MTEPVDRKIIEPPDLVEILRAARQAGRTVVQCHGCFDIVHPGHIRYLRFARELGNILVVSLTGDALIDKAPDRPYIPQELRAENLAALEFVDWVVIDPHPTAAELLNVLRPDVYVKGREYAQANDPRFTREREIVESYGGRVIFHSGDVVFSSTRLLESISCDQQLDEHRLRTLCERSQINTTTISQSLEQFPKLRAVVVGDLICERYVLCDVGTPADGTPTPTLRHLGEREYWGGAAAVALQLQALGAQPFILTAIGSDQRSEEVATRLHESQISGHLLRGRPAAIERRTFLADDSKLFTVTEGESSPLDSAEEKQVHAFLREHLAEADLLIWCDHGYGMVTPALMQAVVAAHHPGLTVAGYTPSQHSPLTGIQHADLLTGTERQFREASQDMNSGLPAVTWKVLTATHSHAAIVSLRKRGLIGFDGRASYHSPQNPDQPTSTPVDRLRSAFVPSLALNHIDWLGVEEAVLTTAALALAAGGPLPLATYLASGAETLAVARQGGKPITTDEMHAWLTSRPELRRHSPFMPDAATLSDIALLAPPLAVGEGYE
ncbi:MAG: PfkB family carbohydrate kinase [Planctomycetota bacterium]